MPYVPVVNVCSVQMVYLMEGQFCENVFNVQFPTAPTAATMNTVAGVFKAWHSATLSHVQAPTPFLQKILVKDLTTALGGGVEYTTGMPAGGAGGGTASPMNVTVAIKWLTGFRGRSYRGRTYHIGLREEDYTNSVMTSARLASLLAAYQDLMATFVTSLPTYSLVVVSRRENKVPRITGVASIITGVSIDATLDSQRRRLPGRGR